MKATLPVADLIYDYSLIHDCDAFTSSEKISDC